MYDMWIIDLSEKGLKVLHFGSTSIKTCKKPKRLLDETLFVFREIFCYF